MWRRGQADLGFHFGLKNVRLRGREDNFILSFYTHINAAFAPSASLLNFLRTKSRTRPFARKQTGLTRLHPETSPGVREPHLATLTDVGLVAL